MKAVLKSIHSPELLNIEKDIPEDPRCFAILYELKIGSDEQKGEDIFQLVVLTPRWMLKNWTDTDIVWGFHHLIVIKYDHNLILQKIKDFVNSQTADDWDGIVNKLSLIGEWEFKDYYYIGN